VDEHNLQKRIYCNVNDLIRHLRMHESGQFKISCRMSSADFEFLLYLVGLN
jgi:hypothetical protein